MRFPRLIAVGITGSLLLLPSVPRAQDRSELLRLREEAAAAHERRDFDAFLELTQRIVEQAPRSVGALYNLACAQALNGEGSAALRTLDGLAAREVAFDLAADPDLQSLRELPGFQEVARRMAVLEEPFGKSRPAFTLPDKTLITEGVAFDPRRGDFFVSSVRHRKIVRISPEGKVGDFLEPGRDGFYSAVALDVDPKRNVLWASSYASPQMEGFRQEDEGRSFVAELDLETSKLLRRVEPPSIAPPAHLSDLAVGPEGQLAVSDPFTGRIYLLPPEEGSLQVLVDVGPLASPQGLAWSPDGRWLFTADYAQGIARVDPRDGSVLLLPIPEDAVVTGIDGLIWAEGSLVGIQNGVRPHRVARHRLDSPLSRIEEITVLERAHPLFDEPTLGVRVGAVLYYVANSQYRFVRDDGTLELDRLQPPVILRAPLSWMSKP
jgi:hypothetical protein